MLSFLGLLLLLTSFHSNELTVHGFANPKSDFLLEIDGNSVSVSREHACAIEQKQGSTIGGRVKCWGLDLLENRLEAPSDVDFVQVITGLYFSCGISVDQTLLCWGQINGQIPGLYTQISADSDGYFGCGLLVDGNIHCWGDITINLKPPPIKHNRKYVQVSCSGRHCCALDNKGYPSCWGDAPKEELILPEITYREYLESKEQFAWIVKAEDIFEEDNEDLRDDAQDTDSETTTGANGEQTTPMLHEKSLVQFRQISVGRSLSCGITLFGGHVLCWGHPRNLKFILSQAIGPYRQLSVGDLGVCAITGDPEEFGMTSEQSEEEYDDEDEGEVVNKNKRNQKNSHSTTAALLPPDSLVCWGSAKGYIDANAFESWDQVTVGSTQVCGVSMDSELLCSGHTVPPHEKIVIA